MENILPAQRFGREIGVVKRDSNLLRSFSSPNFSCIKGKLSIHIAKGGMIMKVISINNFWILSL
jgi:hypothetical protein